MPNPGIAIGVGGIGASLFSSSKASSAAKSAASTAAAGADTAAQVQLEMFNQIQADQRRPIAARDYALDKLTGRPIYEDVTIPGTPGTPGALGRCPWRLFLGGVLPRPLVFGDVTDSARRSP